MASLILHIKDSYYFEVPKALWPSRRENMGFPDVWVRLDPDFQAWQAKQICSQLQKKGIAGMPPSEELLAQYEHWKHDHANLGKPFGLFLETRYQAAQKQDLAAKKAGKSLDSQDAWLVSMMNDPGQLARWEAINDQSNDIVAYKASAAPWSAEKIAAYNRQLDGKIIIPQPLGTLRNLYEPESGFCLSKFMIIEVAVALILFVVFRWLAGRIVDGSAPRGRRWNLLEVFVVFIRDQVARPAIGCHDADRFVPLLLTLFFFVLGCNLMGMLPWLGAPTASWAVTFALACVTFGTVIIFGMLRFGVIGFFLNQIPGMDLPLILAVVIKPTILLIELAGLLIKHAVLSVRLLANMVAGHIVLLAIMTLAFSAAGAASQMWGLTAVICVVGATLFSCLELFVAFLQAYIFVFLSALFIGAAIHHH